MSATPTGRTSTLNDNGDLVVVPERIPLVGVRGHLREFTMDDVWAVAGWIHSIDESDAGLWLEDVLLERFAGPRTRFTFAIDGDGLAVGAVLLSIDSLYDQRGEVGFVVDAEHRDCGRATAAVSAVEQWAFDALGLHRIWAVTAPDNRPAKRVLVRTGHVLEGRLSDDQRVGNTWRDSLLFARIAPA